MAIVDGFHYWLLKNLDGLKNAQYKSSASAGDLH